MMTESTMRVIDLINVASEHLKANGFDNSRLEVERLLGSVLELSRIDLYVKFERPLTDKEVVQFRRLYKRRLTHEPLQHILGNLPLYHHAIRPFSDHLYSKLHQGLNFYFPY